MGQILAVANQKGGAGKTTTVVGLAGTVALAGYRVLVIDLDPQGYATVHLGRSELLAPTDENLMSDLGGSTKGPLDRHVATAVWSTATGGRIDLVPSSPTLHLADRWLAPHRAREARLKRALLTARVAERYDLVLIDCPPTLGVLTDSAILAAEAFVVPAAAEPFSTHAVELLAAQTTGLAAAYGTNLTCRGVVLCRVDTTSKVAEEVTTELGARGMPILGRVHRRAVIQRASGAGVPVQQLEPHGHAAVAFAQIAERLGLPYAIAFTRDGGL